MMHRAFWNFTSAALGAGVCVSCTSQMVDSGGGRLTVTFPGATSTSAIKVTP